MLNPLSAAVRAGIGAGGCMEQTMMNSIQTIHPLALVEGFQKYLPVLEVLRQCGADVGVQIPAGGKVCIMLMAPHDNFRKLASDTFKVYPAGTWNVGTICTAVMDLTQYWSGTKATKVTGMIFPCVMPYLAERYMAWSQHIPDDGEAHPYADFLAACDPWFDGVADQAETAGVFFINMPAGHIAKVRAALLHTATEYLLMEVGKVGGLVGDYKIHHHEFQPTAEAQGLLVADRVTA